MTSSSPLNRMLRRVLTVVIVVAVLISLFVRIRIWQEATRVHDRLVLAKSQLKEIQIKNDEAKAIPRRVDDGYEALREQKTILERSIRSFNRDEMAEKLAEQIKASPDVGLLHVHRNNTMRSTSSCMFVPGAGQSLVVFLKFGSLDSKVGMDLFESPDHFFELSLPANKMFIAEVGLRDDPELHFVLRVDDQNRKIPLPNWASNGYQYPGISESFAPVNFFAIGAEAGSYKLVTECRHACFERGIWKVLQRRSFNLRHTGEGDDAGKRQSLHMVVGLKSAGPFYADYQSKIRLSKQFEMSWDGERKAYLLESIKAK